MNVDVKVNFLRNWLSTVSNPTSNVLQVLQDKFQSNFEERFSVDQNESSYLYPWNDFDGIQNTCDINNDDKNREATSNNQKQFRGEDGKIFTGTLMNGKRSGRGVLFWKDSDMNTEVQVEGFYHQNLLVGNVARITKGKYWIY